MEEFEIEFKELDQFEIEDVREVVVQEVPTFPALENLTVTPTTEEQVFNHENSYGYDEVRVEAVQGKSIEVTPSNEEQTFSDLYTNVKVQGDEDLVASNIKQGVEIFGVTGSLEEMTTETKEGINNQEEIITNQETTLEEINQAIQDKILVKEKYKPRRITFSYYAGTELNEELSNLDISNITSFERFFERCQGLTSLDLSKWDTKNITSMYYMFYYCQKLTSLNISSFNTSNVTNMSYMFYYCQKLTSLNLSNFNTSNVTSMDSMFRGCEGLISLDLSSFDTSKVTNMNYMFTNNANLIELNLSNFDISNITSTLYGTFQGCKGLQKLDIRGMDFTNAKGNNMFLNVPTSCLIIVKDENAKQWVLTQRSDFTNVKTVAELEG